MKNSMTIYDVQKNHTFQSKVHHLFKRQLEDSSTPNSNTDSRLNMVDSFHITFWTSLVLFFILVGAQSAIMSI